jgi:hypothetical protein
MEHAVPDPWHVLDPQESLMKKPKQTFSVRPGQPRKPPSVRAEADAIVASALTGEGRLASLSGLIFFSTETQDAWVLDPADGLAAPLCRAGSPLPVRIEEDDERSLVEWTHDFAIEGEAFVAIERRNGAVRRIEGYPTREIAALHRSASKPGRTLM